MHQRLGARSRAKASSSAKKPSHHTRPTRSKALHTKPKSLTKLHSSRHSTSTISQLDVFQSDVPLSSTAVGVFRMQTHQARRRFTSSNNDIHDEEDGAAGTAIQFATPTNPLNDPLANTSLDQLMKTRPAGPTAAAKRVSKQRLEKEKKQNDQLVNTLYGDYVDANDRGDGLVWAGAGPETSQQDDSVPLHEKILQLYLDNYQQQENREHEAHFEGGKEDDEMVAGRDQFLQQIVNTLNPKNYSRFVHSFRLCIQKLRTLLSKHQQQKQQLKDNVHMITNFSQQETALQQRYQHELQEVQITFFRQAAKLFGDDSDVFMPQLVIHLSSLTLTQLENYRERQSTSQMNLYSCGFWTPHDIGRGGDNATTAFREQFHTYLEENNPTAGTKQPIATEQIALESYTFPVRVANKLYSDLDIYTDQTSPLFFNKLTRVHQRSHKVFVSNIPSTLTTRELMALFGNCGVLNAAEIYRDKLNQDSGSTLEAPQQPHAHSAAAPSTRHKSGPMPGDDTLYQGLSLSKKEAILQANAAALTIDISDIALGHFTSSFKSDRLLVPSHVIDGKLIEATVSSHNMLGSDGQRMDPIASIFQQQDGSSSQIDAFPEHVQDNFNSELQKFENLHTKRQQRQQKKFMKAMRESGDGGELDSQQPTLDSSDFSVADSAVSAHSAANKGIGASKYGGKGGSSEVEKYALRDLHSPVYGFLYFANAAGKRRALRQSLQVFGLSTASGYAMTTQDATEKNQLVISGLHRSMSSADVAHFIRETLEEFMPLTKSSAAKPLISTNSFDSNDHAAMDSGSQESVIDRVYLPRSYARSLGSQDLFNNNRGYAIVTFDTHETAFNAFRYLQNSTITFNNPQLQANNNTNNHNNGVEPINANFDALQISNQFSTLPTQINASSAPAVTSRTVNVHWRKEKNRPQKQQHPITSYFPTFERPKQRLFQKVSQQLKNALPQVEESKQEVGVDAGLLMGGNKM